MSSFYNIYKTVHFIHFNIILFGYGYYISMLSIVSRTNSPNTVCKTHYLCLTISLSVEDLMHMACSSVLCGGGTNQELAHHCLYECKGDIMVSVTEQSVLISRAGMYTIKSKNEHEAVAHDI